MKKEDGLERRVARGGGLAVKKKFVCVNVNENTLHMYICQRGHHSGVSFISGCIDIGFVDEISLFLSFFYSFLPSSLSFPYM